MNTLHTRSPFARSIGLAAVLALGSGWAMAHTPNEGDAQARYREERAACMSGTSHQDRATCLKEAQAALAEARRGRLSTGAGSDDYRANALARCDVQPERDRADCRAMVTGQGTSSGSVGQGAIVREHVRRVPAKREPARSGVGSGAAAASSPR